MVFLLFTLLNLIIIKDKLIDLIERTFNREGSPYLACNDRNAFFTVEYPKNVCDALTFLLDYILFDLAPSCIDRESWESYGR